MACKRKRGVGVTRGAVHWQTEGVSIDRNGEDYRKKRVVKKDWDFCFGHVKFECLLTIISYLLLNKPGMICSLCLSILHKVTKEERVLVKSDLIDFKTKFVTIALFCLNP